MKCVPISYVFINIQYLDSLTLEFLFINMTCGCRSFSYVSTQDLEAITLISKTFKQQVLKIFFLEDFHTCMNEINIHLLTTTHVLCHVNLLMLHFLC